MRFFGAKWMFVAVVLAVVLGDYGARAMTVGEPGGDDLVVAENGTTKAVVAVSPQAADNKARRWERQAAQDLAYYIARMSGAEPRVVDEAKAIDEALAGNAPVLLVGALALEKNGGLRKALEQVADPEPYARNDAIVVRREGNRIYLAGNSDDSHYHAVSYLLHEWGCRWYLPTEFGECIPEHDRLAVGRLDYTYAPPFEVRDYWLAWNASREGHYVFKRRNFMNTRPSDAYAGAIHALGKYTRQRAQELDVSGKRVPFAEPETTESVVDVIKNRYPEPPQSISLAIQDGVYDSDSEIDERLRANLWDKYFLRVSQTDPMMALYVNVCERLKQENFDTRIGGMAYVNVTIPPQRKWDIPDNLHMWLAPIDIDPNHHMNDPRSPPRREYGAMMHRWADIMDGRILIYDYDQGMLVWRDLPNPSHHAFRHDVKEYRDAGILGLSTETRGAAATTFINFHIRGQLMWNPDLDLDAWLEDFYPKFYGPASEPMSRYWNAIYDAWEASIVTEHEFFAIPAIYTRDLVEELRGYLEVAQAAIKSLRARDEAGLSRNERLYLERMVFTEKSFGVIDGYTAMLKAATTEADYATAVKVGEKALEIRDSLGEMNPTFISTRLERGKTPWFPGEIKQYESLLAMTDGTSGKLIERLPLEWAFRRDTHDTGLPMGFAYKPADLVYWNEHKAEYAVPEQRKDYPTTEWEMARSDLYPQAQGILHPDWQAFTGFMWYKTNVDLDAGQTSGNVHIHFPGLFSEAWLYVNGYLMAHRPQNHMWWHNNYRFDWDVDLTGKLDPGENNITLRVHCTHHVAGMFRRPFLYTPLKQAE